MESVLYYTYHLASQFRLSSSQSMLEVEESKEDRK